MRDFNEVQIMQNWKGDVAEPVVSICCLTYNHKDYIEQAIDGFLMQETDFPFEILIHDDASTDGTKEIIKHYEKLYPNIIKTVIQKENYYSQGGRFMIARFLLPKAKGKYIALCEGDDLWISTNKLYKQFMFMEKNSEYAFCFHDVKQQNDTKNKTSYSAYSKVRANTLYFEDILKEHFVPTLSLFFRKIFLPLNIPSYEKKISSGDIFMELMLAYRGPAYYFDEVMGVYRHHDGGVTKKWSLIDNLENISNLYSEINKLTVGKFSKLINKKMSDIYFWYSKLFFMNADLKNSFYCMYKAHLKNPKVSALYVKEKLCRN